MTDDSKAEDLFFEADKLIDDNQIKEAKELLNDLLNDYPDFGRAHNHLGWLYSVKFNNHPKAKKHLELALKFSPDYMGAYSNYVYLLLEMNKYDELIEFGKKHVDKGVADAGTLYNKMAQSYELKGELMEAYKYYKLAIKGAINNQFLEELYASINRLKGKMTLFQKLSLINKN
jgi:tetratricopeptide (TPR) repeat protein